MTEKIIYTTKTKTGKTIYFRYPTINDVQNVTDFINKASKEKTFITFQGEQQTLSDEQKYLESVVDKIKNNQGVFLLAFDGNKLIGSTDINMMDKTRSHTGIFGIVIDKDYRGQGIGNIMMKSIIKEGKSKIKNLKIVTLDVYAKNFIGQNLYKKMGFIECGRLPNGAKYKGKFDDIISMYKKIN
jgi:RimJ/RimL family protein N-acetyltransferase